MTITEQLKKIKENWLILVLVLVLAVFLSGGLSSFGSGLSSIYSERMSNTLMAYDSVGEYEVARASGGMAVAPTASFDPFADERIITKTASLSTEVDRGNFKEAEAQFKSIIKSSDTFLLNEDVSKYKTKNNEYYRGSYQIKVDVKKYEDVVSQLKTLGEVKSFNENQRDITLQYANLEIEIETEKARLKRYEAMYDEAKEVADKIELNDRIFDQERKIKYMEDSLENLDERVDYSTIYYIMTEKQSEYANVVFAKVSDLVKSMVSSFNSLVKLIFVIVPWAIVGLIIWFVVKALKKRE